MYYSILYLSLEILYLEYDIMFPECTDFRQERWLPMKHHEIIKRLRKERNISQRTLSEGICSRTTLSSFENTGTNISLNLFQSYLDRLNISVEDYFLLHFNEEWPNQTVASNKEKANKVLEKAYYTYNWTDLEEKINHTYQLYMKSNDFYYYYLFIQYKLLLYRKIRAEKFIITENEVMVIKNYLNDVEVWGAFELNLFSNCLSLFNDAYIFSKVKILRKKYRNVRGSFKFYKLYSFFIINVIMLKFERDELENMNFYLAELKSFNTINYVRERILYNIFTEILKCKYEPTVKNFNTIDSFIDMFRLLDFNDYAQEMETFAKKMLGLR